MDCGCGIGSTDPPVRKLRIAPAVGVALAALMGALGASAHAVPTTARQWKEYAAATAKQDTRLVLAAQAKFRVTVTRIEVGGVRCYSVLPEVIAPADRNRLLLGVHGGGFVTGGGESGLLDAIEMAGLTGIKVISVDYRMPPEHPFPEPMDDLVTVWRNLTGGSKGATDMGLFGNSAGGELALALVQRLRREHLPAPAALMVGSPWSDLSKTGDSYFTHAGFDTRLVGYEGLLESMARLYADGRDLESPLLSPVYGEFNGFPPTYLVTGTRDLFLSNTVRVHLKLLQARVPAQLEVEEGEPHVQFIFGALAGAPASIAVYRRIRRFFEDNLTAGNQLPVASSSCTTGSWQVRSSGSPVR